jgi:phosphatidylglycerol:prolipoprotein diacylglycerol transferase
MMDKHFVPDGFGILPKIELFGISISSYSLFVGLAIFAGIVCFVILSRSSKIKRIDRALILLSALIGGVIGSKIPVIIANIKYMNQYPLNMNILLYEKSIVGGLIGGFLSVIIIKKAFSIKARMGNDIAPAAALGMGIGRIGCFLAGCCYGKPTGINFGVNFGDGVYRHPTQLYEMAFCFILFGVLLYLRLNTDEAPGRLFKILVNAYFIFRFFNEFLRVTDMALPFLSVYQVICLVCLIVINRTQIKNMIISLLKRKEHLHEQ